MKKYAEQYAHYFNSRDLKGIESLVNGTDILEWQNGKMAKLKNSEPIWMS